jgi:predicted enzyme related to lactoylglutathione lyase
VLGTPELVLSRVTGKPQVISSPIAVSTDKRASSDYCSAGEKPTSRYKSYCTVAYQQAIFQQRQPAAMFFTDDVKGDYERIKARGAEFTMPPTDVTGSTIAMLNDTCGNLIQLTQLARYSR